MIFITLLGKQQQKDFAHQIGLSLFFYPCEIIESIIGVQWGQENPNLSANRSSGKRDLPRGVIFLEPLNSNG